MNLAKELGRRLAEQYGLDPTLVVDITIHISAVSETHATFTLVVPDEALDAISRQVERT